MHHHPLIHRFVATSKQDKLTTFFDMYQGTRLSQDRSKIQKAALQLIEEIDSPTPQQMNSALNKVIESIKNSIQQTVFGTTSTSSQQLSIINHELESRNILQLFSNDFETGINNYLNP